MHAILQHRWVRRCMILAGLGVMAAASLYATRLSWGPGMIIPCPDPQYTAGPLPTGVSRAVDIERDGVRVRSWVLEPPGPPRGTVMLLHGIRSNKERHLPAARDYAARGFRTIAVDSRGHGESSGRYLTYGVEESEDLRALADALARESLLAEPLVVVGSSYGAATAIQYAALDSRVDLTIALASFASLEEVVPAYVEWILGPLAVLVPDGVVVDVLAESARVAEFDPADACPRCAAARLTAPLRLVHSEDDERIPLAHARAIAAAAPDAELVVLHGASHGETGGASGVRTAVDRWLAEVTGGP